MADGEHVSFGLTAGGVKFAPGTFAFWLREEGWHRHTVDANGELGERADSEVYETPGGCFTQHLHMQLVGIPGATVIVKQTA